MMTRPRLAAILPIALLACATLGACDSGGPTASPSTAPAGPSQDARDLPTSAPRGGGSNGNTGVGIVDPAPPGGGIDPIAGGQAKLVVPKPGQRDPHPVAPIKLQTSVDGRHVLVKVWWYSGIEPCSVLDSVSVTRTETEIAISPLEGVGDVGAVCIDIAELKATIVDLGDLGPGTWQIAAPGGDARPVELTIR